MKTPQVHTAMAAALPALTARGLLDDEVVVVDMGEEIFTYSESLQTAYFMSEIEDGEYILIQCFKNVNNADHAKSIASKKGLV